MTEARSGGNPGREAEDRSGATRYPENHVVGILEPTRVDPAVAALTGGGFLESEIRVTCGQAAADALHASTGRTGLAHVAVRIAEWFGVSDEEMKVKDRYERALREGRCLVLALAPTDDRKALAGRILREHGGEFVNFLGKYSMEPLRR